MTEKMKMPGRGLALRKAKRGPNENRRENERHRIVFRRDGKPSAKDRFAHEHHQDQKRCDFDCLAPSPTQTGCATPKNDQRRDDEIAGGVA